MRQTIHTPSAGAIDTSRLSRVGRTPGHTKTAVFKLSRRLKEFQKGYIEFYFSIASALIDGIFISKGDATRTRKPYGAGIKTQYVYPISSHPWY